MSKSLGRSQGDLELSFLAKDTSTGPTHWNWSRNALKRSCVFANGASRAVDVKLDFVI